MNNEDPGRLAMDIHGDEHAVVSLAERRKWIKLINARQQAHSLLRYAKNQNNQSSEYLQNVK